ncbi:MAG: hypothetical protein KDA54_19065, partial [Phycisphaerales bacterium]|nr:hypothetical protein [Phycisphaerales bacterium]
MREILVATTNEGKVREI